MTALRSLDGHCGERATVLVLVPAMTLVMLCLGAMAIDLSLLHAAHREAHRVIAGAADDAAMVIDEARLQASGEVVIDPDRARRMAEARIAAADLSAELLSVEITTGPSTVAVSARLAIDHVLLPSLPGRDSSTTFEVSARARLHR
jgi:hypothetical protein